MLICGLAGESNNHHAVAGWPAMQSVAASYPYPKNPAENLPKDVVDWINDWMKYLYFTTLNYMPKI